MFITSWIERISQSLKQNCRRTSGRRDVFVRACERLEERSLLSAQAFFLNGEIDITLGPTDNVAVRENPVALGTVQILLNGIPETNFPIVSTSSVTKLLVTGGDDGNLIDLTGVTAAVFNNAALSIEAHGGNGADTLLGSDSLADSLDGGHGADSIVGNGGNDTLLGDDGNDTINGGTGDDNIDAGDGQDTVDGGAGNDTIIAGDGQDSITGSAGNDSISGGDGADTLLGGDDADIINGGAGTDSIDGQNGDDTIFGAAGNDTLLGGSGADSLDGQGGNDLVFAEAVTGQAPVTTTVTTTFINSTVFTTNFDSGVPAQISGTTKTAAVQGFVGLGTGTNTFGGNLLQNDTGGTVPLPGSIPQVPTTLTLTNLPTHTSIDLNFLLAIINSFNGLNPNVSFANDFFNVVVDGTSLFHQNFSNDGSPNFPQGYNAPPGVALTPPPLSDRGFPDTGNNPNLPDSAWNMGLDPLFDNIPHTASTLTIDFFADGSGFEGGTNESWGIDNLQVILNGVPVVTTTVTTIVSDDTLQGSAGNDTLNGADGNDLLNGGAGDDLGLGLGGNDSILGGAGNDVLYGDDTTPNQLSNGNDTIFGNGGDDTLNGGGGGDLIDGGSGNDLVQSGDFDTSVGIIITINNAPNVVEGNQGQTTNVVFTVSLNRPSAQTVTVQYATADGSATGTGANADYTPASGTLTFAPGTTSLTVSVTVIGDGQLEADENFFVRLSNSTKAIIGDTEGETFILNDDGWQSAGPTTLNNGQQQNVSPNNEISGAIQSVATSPTNSDLMFVGSVNGGIWKTTNATASQPTWVPQTDFLPSLSIGDVQFDSTDASGNTLVAGIARSSSFAAVGGPSTGLLRTTDGGATWTQLNPANIQGETFLRVAARGNIIMGASDGRWAGGGQRGLFRSTDSGVTFTQISGSGTGLPNGPVSDLEGDPNNPALFYAAVRQVGIFRSNDSGATWTNVTNGITGIAPGTQNVQIAVHSTATSNAVYVVVADNTGAGWTQLFRSTDQGATWTALDVPAAATGGSSLHGAIVADPANPSLVYVSGSAQNNTLLSAVRVDASLAAGSQVTSIVGANAQNTQPHADSRRMAFMANGFLVNVNDGGIVRRSNPQTNNGAWTSLNGSLQVMEAHDTVFDPVSRIVISGTQDNGTNQQTATGSLVWTHTFGGDGGDVAVDAIQLAAQNRSIRYTSAQTLGGFNAAVYSAANTLISTTFLPLTVTNNGAAIVAQFATPIATDSVAGNRLIIGGANSTYESLDGGQTVQEIGRGVGVNGSGPGAIAYGGTLAGVANPDVLYVGSNNRVFVRTVAGGALAPTAAAFPGGQVQDIVLDPANWQNAWVVGTNGVFATTTAGAAWINETGNLAASQDRTIEFVGGATPSLFLGAQEGVFRMLLSAVGTWSEFGASSLPNCAVWDLDYDPATDELVAGTMGRGAWIFAGASLGQQLNNPVPGTGGIVSFIGVGDTLQGSSGDDLIQGSDGNDVINADGGNDTVFGGNGNDLLLGGSGADSLDGQGGDDTLAGQGGKDTLIGNDGNDVFQWSVGDGDDLVSSVNGFDQMQVFGTNASDSVSVSKVGPKLKVTSGSNDLTINADIHVVTIDMGAGDDVVTIGDLSGVSQTVLTINGGDGNDKLDATAGVLGDVRLRLNGEAGNDSINGSSNDDTIDGGAGKDTLLGGSGNDTIFGGADNDAINGQAGDDSITGDDGNDSLAGGDGNDIVSGGLGNDSLNGNAGADTLIGAEGRDTLLGGADNDSLDAGSGRDYLSGGDGNDTLDGGRNDDTILGDAGNDTIRGDHGNDTIDGGTGDDTISGGDGNDTITGGDGNDLVTGADGDDVINGAAGNDTLSGGDGNDVIAGGGGADIILGDDGDDTLNGNGGSNTIAGGQGNDTILSLPTDVLNDSFVLSADLLAKLDLV